MSQDNEQLFYLPEFYEITKKVIENGKDIQVNSLLPVYNYMTKLFNCIGAGFGFAISDITNKIDHVIKRRQELIDNQDLPDDPHMLLYTLMKAEETKGWIRSGSKGIESKGREFQCASRSVLRLTWFLDFIYEIIKQVYENPDLSLQSAVRTSYHLTLETKHNFIIRNAFKVAVVVCPSRTTFLENIQNGITEQEMYDYWPKVQKNLLILKMNLWEIYKENNWQDLP